MLNKKQIDLSETNLANFGTDLEKKIKQAAAEHEQAWIGCGQKPGLDIWRIEQFKVIAWPKDQYGNFFSGDSYIILHTYKKKDSDALGYQIHFWLGQYTTQDESGTAAYKTVELDDHLKGIAPQYREVQGYESDLFLSYFDNSIHILEGGIESGFKHVEPEKYVPKLLHIKGKKNFRITEVPMTSDSLNSGDVFILDNGFQIYQWNGSKAGHTEKFKGSQISRLLSDERKAIPTVEVFDEGDKDDGVFWKILGGKGPIKSAEQGGSDIDVKNNGIILFEMLEESGNLLFKEVARDDTVKKSSLDTNAVFILDNIFEVFVWIGLKSTINERRNALVYAQTYLKNYNRPAHLSICKMLEGGESELFKSAFLL